MTVTTNTVANVIEQLAPKSLAESWDFVGLQVGSNAQPVKRILVTLDVRQATVQEAIENDVDLIVAHHPLLFKPIRPLDVASVEGKIIAQLIKHNISVYAAHTNLDKADGGMNDWLAAALGLQNVTALSEDGLGRIGTLKQPLTPAKFGQMCLQNLNVAAGRLITSKSHKLIQTVAVLGGSGSSLLNEVITSQADAYVSGDISYHTAQAFADNDITVADVGHHVEAICIPHLTAYLSQKLPAVEVIESMAKTDPYQFISQK